MRFLCQLRRFNSLGASVYIRRIYLHCNGDYCTRTSTGDKTKVLVKPCTLNCSTEQDKGTKFESHALTAVTGPATLFLTICPSKSWSDCQHPKWTVVELKCIEIGALPSLRPHQYKSRYFWNRIFLTKSVLPSTRNKWIHWRKLLLFETALQSCQGSCPHKFG